MLSILLLAVAAADPCAVPEARPAADWKAIAQAGFVLPEGGSVEEAFGELDALFVSPDPDLRDGVGYEATVAWVYKERKVDDGAIRDAARRWEGHLRCGIGAKGDDRVLLRSFSALSLSILAAADLKRGWTRPEDFQALLSAAVAYLPAERDLRDWDPERGWIHATAHDADLLKFLGRSAKLDPAGQKAILDAIADRVLTAPAVFTHAEDERLASAVASVARRQDLDLAAFEGFVKRLAGADRGLWTEKPFDHARYLVSRNAANTLKDLYLILLAAPGADGAKEIVRRSILG